MAWCPIPTSCPRRTSSVFRASANLGILTCFAPAVTGDGDPGEGGAAPRFFGSSTGRPDGNAEVIPSCTATNTSPPWKEPPPRRSATASASASPISAPPDTHTFPDLGHSLTVDNLALLPTTGFTAELIEDNPGTWTIAAGGSYANYTVEP